VTTLVLALGGLATAFATELFSHALPVEASLGALAKPPAALASVGPRADRDVDRSGEHLLITGGVFYVPPSFASEGGEFDLLIHFHGNAELVEQSVAESKLDALVYVVNVGHGASAYRDYGSAPGMCNQLLDKATDTAVARGLHDARARRMALSAWSAGYAAVGALLDSCAERVDAVLLADGLHVPFVDRVRHSVDAASLGPFLSFAERASKGERLMVVTHSEVETYGYASSARTAQLLLESLGIVPKPANASPSPATFPAAKKAAEPGHDSKLFATSDAQRGKLHVMGFSGEKRAHHMDHLIHMSKTLLPPLVERWTDSGSAP
jgi:hypothetical protein